MKPYYLSDLELRHLLALRAIAECGSFWDAAERLGCSQSALSQQIATAERLIGTQLFDRRRGRRSVAITEAGSLLLKHADAIVARLRAAHADFTAFAEGGAGSLRVGTFESSGVRILPPLLREFRQKWPKIEIRLTEVAKDDQLLRLVEQGDIDMTFATLPLPDGPFASAVLLQDPYVLVIAADARRRHRGPIKLKDIREQPLISFGHGRTVEQLEAHLKSRGVAPNIVFRSNYNGMVQGLAAAGVGAALVPLLTVDRRRTDTCILGPLTELPPRIVCMAWHMDRYRSAAAKAFVETAQRLCAKMSRQLGSE